VVVRGTTAIGIAVIAACKFSPSSSSSSTDAPIIATDGPISIDVPPPPDAGPCAGASVECANEDTLRVCTTQGGLAMDTTCTWGCLTTGGAHCGVLAPSGGVATGSDTIDPDHALGSGVTLQNNAVIDQVTGVITDSSGTVRGSGTGIVDGIDFEQRSNGAAVFRFTSLEIKGSLGFTEPGPVVVLVSTSTISVDGAVNAQGGCTGGNGGPGGFAGAMGAHSASGSGGGAAGTSTTMGAGGGGYGATGGAGGTNGAAGAAGGAAFGTDAIALLVGGGGGGGGSGGNPYGGGGGGGVQLVANTSLSIGSAASINAGGCGGTSGRSTSDSGGGGGAGGTILLEAHDATIAGQLAVNGGGGGGNYYDNPPCTTSTGAGGNGGLGRTPTIGGIGCAANGGSGGAGATLAGMAGGNGSYMTTGDYSAGGGGSVGRMRFNTASGSANVADLTRLSPSLDDPATTCTQGSASVQ
jgi:hypothetical protein